MSGWVLVRDRARITDTIVAAIAVLLAVSGITALFLDLSWVLPAITVIAVVATLGAIGRALNLPLPFIPLLQALGMMVALSLMFVAETAWAHVVPTTASWDALRLLAADGLLDAQTYFPPVAPFPGMVVLAVGAIGLVALSTDTLFVSVRAPLLAGIPLATTFVVTSILMPGGLPAWAFPLTAVGWLLILAADQRDRVRTWGGLPPHTRVRGLSSGARRTGAIAVVVATLAMVVVPAAGNPWGGAGDGSGGGTLADGGPVVLDPLVSMRRNLVLANDTEVLTYQTQAKSPSYLRLTALENFDGTTWRQRTGLETGRDQGIPIPGDVLEALTALDTSYRVTGGDSYTYDFQVTNLDNAYLPLPFPVAAVDDAVGLDANWRLDPSTGVASSQEEPATGLAYRVVALDPRIQSGQLRGASAATGDFWPLLNLPGGLSPTIQQTALDVTASATTPYDKAIALQRWFTREGGFTYSTDVRSGTDADYLAQFLKDRVGYCEQFAGAMAVMARTLGIPSRVVVGFTQGTKDEDGTWHVTVRDAHAWPELWFDGVGWARFEPTPRSNGTVQTPEYARTPDVGTAGGDALDRRTPRDLDAAPVGSTGTGLHLPIGPIAALIVLVVIVLLSRPMLARQWRRRRRLHGTVGAAAVLAAWDEVGDLAVDLGQPWTDVSTPRQAAERLSRGMPEAPAAALRRLRQEVERVKYADPRAGGRGGQGAAMSTSAMSTERTEAVRADVQVVAAELRRRVRWQTRVAAYCWPSSERRRQRSSMRSMNPPEADGLGAAAGAAGASASAGRAVKAE